MTKIRNSSIQAVSSDDIRFNEHGVCFLFNICLESVIFDDITKICIKLDGRFTRSEKIFYKIAQ